MRHRPGSLNGITAVLGTRTGVEVHADVHNHFNHERHLVDRQTYKQRRTAAPAEWQALAS